MERPIREAVLSAPGEWVRDEGWIPPEDSLIDMALQSDNVVGLEIRYKDGSGRTVPKEDLCLLALVVEAMRVFPGSELAISYEDAAVERWPKQ